MDIGFRKLIASSFVMAILAGLALVPQSILAVAKAGSGGRPHVATLSPTYLQMLLDNSDEFKTTEDFLDQLELELSEDEKEPKVKDDYCKELNKPGKKSKEAQYCILWSEIGSFQSESPIMIDPVTGLPAVDSKGKPVTACSTDPTYPENPDFKEACEQHALSLACRNSKNPKTIRPEEVNCECPPNMKVVPADKASDRTWGRIKACIDRTLTGFDAKTEQQKAAACDKFYHFYHESPGYLPPETRPPEDPNYYLLPHRRCAEDKDAHRPAGTPRRIIPLRKMPASTCEEWHVVFPCGVEDPRFTRSSAISAQAGDFTGFENDLQIILSDEELTTE